MTNEWLNFAAMPNLDTGEILERSNAKITEFVGLRQTFEAIPIYCRIYHKNRIV